MCCSCPPCLEAAAHLVCAVCGGVVADSSYGYLTFSLYLLTGCSIIAELHREVGRGECSSGVLWVWPCLTWWYLVFVCRR